MRKKAGIGMRRSKTLFYCIGQGLKGVWKNRIYSLASAGTIAACILLLGVFFFVTENFNAMVKSAETMVGVTVFFEEGTTEERILAIRDQVRLRAEVQDIVYLSAEQAWENYKTENLNPELAAVFGEDNPLKDLASLEITLNDVKMQDSLVRYLGTIKNVRKVNHSDSVAEGFADIQAILYAVSVGLIAILAAVALFLIRTTISTGIHVRKEEIFIMSIIGASDFFIRAPFVVEGMVIGALGAVLPLGILSMAYGKMVGILRGQFESTFSKLHFLERDVILRRFLPIALLFSIGIGLIASYLTSKRQIKRISFH